MLIQGQVGAPSNNSATDGNNYTALQGKATEMIVAELHGKYWTQNYRGHIFSGSTAQAGITVPSSTSLSATFALWNPTGSGVIAVPLRIVISQTGTTLYTGGSFGWAVTAGAGANIGTAAPFTAFTASTPVGGINLLAGSGAYSLMGQAQTKLTVSAATLTSLPTVGDWLSATLSSQAAGNSVATIPAIDLDGMTGIAPNTAWSLCFSNASGTTGSVVVTIKWAEIPV